MALPLRPLPAPRRLALALALLAPSLASAQSFSDFESIGKLEDARRQPSPIGVGGHSFEPTINYKLFGVTTPHVAASTRLGWTDNYLLEDTETPGVTPRRELFARLNAGARLDTQISDHRLELAYHAAATELIQSGSGDTLEQRGSARLDLYGVDVEAHLDGAWSRSSYPQSIQLVGIVQVEAYSTSAWGELRVGRAGVRVGARFVDTDYLDGNEQLDSQQAGGDVQLYWRVRSKLRALVEYNYSMLLYDEGRQGSLNDYQVHTVRGGLDGELTPKLHASLKVGAAFQDAERGPNSDERDFTGAVAELSLRWQPLEKTSVIATYVHSLSPSTDSNRLLQDDAFLQVQQMLVVDRVTASAGVGYTHARTLPGLHLNRLRAGASVEWKITRWLSLIADYRFVKLVSSAPDSDYSAHTAGISLGVGL